MAGQMRPSSTPVARAGAVPAEPRLGRPFRAGSKFNPPWALPKAGAGARFQRPPIGSQNAGDLRAKPRASRLTAAMGRGVPTTARSWSAVKATRSTGFLGGVDEPLPRTWLAGGREGQGLDFVAPGAWFRPRGGPVLGVFSGGTSSKAGQRCATPYSKTLARNGAPRRQPTPRCSAISLPGATFAQSEFPKPMAVRAKPKRGGE